MVQSGIYEISNTATGHRYIGSARNLAARWNSHKGKLKSNCHHNPRLAKAWHEFGEAAFEFRPLVICANDDLLDFEQRCLDAFEPEYNVAMIAGYRTFAGLRHSPETLAKMSAAKLGNTATRGKKKSAESVAKTAAAHRGMKRSAETRAKISASRQGKKMPPRSAEYRAKLSAAQKGKPHPLKKCVRRKGAARFRQNISARSGLLQKPIGHEGNPHHDCQSRLWDA